METGNDTVFILTKEDVVECAREMGIPAEMVGALPFVHNRPLLLGC